mgnify:CR=1 FL=1
MAFNLPAAISLHRDSADDNVGSIGTGLTLRSKSQGNLPITDYASRIQYNAPTSATGTAEGVFFGFTDQTTVGSVDLFLHSTLFIWSVQFNAPNRIQISDLANGGMRFWLGSGTDPTNNYREYFIGGNDTPFGASIAGAVTICIDLADTSHDNQVGNFDKTQVSAYGLGIVRFNLGSTGYGDLLAQRSILMSSSNGEFDFYDIPTFTGNSSFDDAISLVQGSDYTDKIGNWATKSGSSIFLPVPFSIGDGSSAVSFDDNGASIVSPASNADNQENFRITTNAMRVYLNTRNSFEDGVTLSGNYNWGSPAPWDFSQDYPAVVADLSGTFTGMGNFTMGRSCYLSGTVSLADGYSLISSGANLDDATINNDLTIQTTDVTAYDNLTVVGNIQFAIAGSFSFTNSRIKSLANISGGNITITLDNTTIEIPPTDPSITIVQAPRTLTLTGLQLNSEVRVYEAGTRTELAGIEDAVKRIPADLDATFTFDNLSVNRVDIVIHHVSYEYLKISGANTENNLTLPIQQRFDRSYANG